MSLENNTTELQEILNTVNELPNQSAIDDSNYAKLDSSNTFTKTQYIGAKYAWSEDLITNQTDLSGLTIKFDTTAGADKFLIYRISYFRSSNGYYLYGDYNSATSGIGTMTFKDSSGTILDTFYNATDGWIKDSLKLPNDFGYIVSFGNTAVPTTVPFALQTLNNIAPDGIGEIGTIATQEWVQNLIEESILRGEW